VDGLWAKAADSDPEEAQFGLLAADLKRFGKSGLGTEIVQFYDLVTPGLVLARHIFQGLKRPLYCDENKHGDEDKRVYTWRSSFDVECVNKQPVRRPAPNGKVFVVIVSPNIRHRGAYPDIAGWIEHWNWLGEDTGLEGAPEDWVDRYSTRVWTR
jgi:hypothetical protein